jgi:DNA-binding transcriptional LysR family regulator
VPSRLIVSDVDTMLRACVAGVGIAHVMALGSAGLRRSGELEELLPDWPDERFPLHAIYPTRRHRTAKVRAFTGFCMALLAGHKGPS